jgi:CDP-diacylglycerol--glycerol-3-phosphate 3-phosphatidyltransferase
MAALSLYQGRLTAAGFWILGGAFFDLMDGAVARVTGRTSKFGAVLDSVVDRGTDTLMYLGLALHFHAVGQTAHVALSVLALGGALGVSYARARAENVIADCRVGFAERGERFGVLVLGLFLGRPGAAVSILVVITWLTVLQRLLHVKRVLDRET